MTPKEKSKCLYEKYIVLACDETIEQRDRVAKKCAIIAVDEIIINVLNGIDLPSTWGNYWEEVKQEIEKI